MASAAVVREVAAVAAAERAQLAFIRFLASVRAHVGLQVAFIGRGKRTKMTTVRLFT